MSTDSAIETKYCNNCKKDIAAANFTMHEVHCRRHLVLCTHCEEPVPRTEMDQHFNDVHAKVPCSQCTKQLEKDQLDTHMKTECPKRTVSCRFCELEMPQSDMSGHVEFCGTRTEACPRCGNFIMHKDLDRHNQSNCTYPEVKPPEPPTNDLRDRGGGGGGDDRMFVRMGAAHRRGHGEVYRQLDDSFDPFEFEAIRRALEGGGMPTEVVADSDASAAAAAAAVGVERPGRAGGGGGARKNPLPGAKKNDTRGGARKAATNRRSEVNRRRERASPPAIPPDVDYDTMLAMQLAQEDAGPAVRPVNSELDIDADLNRLLSEFGKRSRPLPVPRPESSEQDHALVSAASPPAFDHFNAADEDMIPCEFCHESFPAFALVHHQSVCDPLASGLWGQGVEVTPNSGRNNNRAALESRWTPAVARPPTIPVINNLGSAATPQEHEEEVSYHLTDNGDHLLSHLDSMENIMLPCEFCTELLPADVLVQHQAMCESNAQGTVTPRLMTPVTPAAAQPSGGVSPTRARNQFFPSAVPNTRRRQPDPTEELLAAISGGEQENQGGNIRPKKRTNASRAGDPAPWKPGNVGRPGESRALQARGGAGRVAGEDTDVALHNHRGSREVRVDSASRTRHTLDALLADPGANERNSQGSRRRTSNNGTPVSVTGAGVSSRTVMRSMQQDPGQRRTQRGADPTEGDSINGRSSQRARGDHLFNSPGNTAAASRTTRTSRPHIPGDWS